MALPRKLDALDDLPEELQEHYTEQEDGTFILALDGDDGLVSALQKERDARKAAERRARDLESNLPPEGRISQLEAENARLSEQIRTGTMQSKVRQELLSNGVRPEAIEHATNAITPDLELSDEGHVVRKGGGTLHQAVEQLRDSAYYFWRPSTGTGAADYPHRPGLQSKAVKDMSNAEKRAYISEYGADAWEQKIESEPSS